MWNKYLIPRCQDERTYFLLESALSVQSEVTEVTGPDLEHNSAQKYFSLCENTATFYFTNLKEKKVKCHAQGCTKPSFQPFHKTLASYCYFIGFNCLSCCALWSFQFAHRTSWNVCVDFKKNLFFKGQSWTQKSLCVLWLMFPVDILGNWKWVLSG